MRTQLGKSPHLLIWCSGIARGLLCAGGIVTSMGWFPTSIASRGDNAVPVNLSAAPAEPAGAKAPTAQAPNLGPLQATCAECGVIHSMQETQEPFEATGRLGRSVGESRRRTAASGSEIHQEADAATVIDWHPYARHGRGCAHPALGAREPGARPAESNYEFAVRLRADSSRVLGESNPAAWRLGAPVKVIKAEVPLIG